MSQFSLFFKRLFIFVKFCDKLDHLAPLPDFKPVLLFNFSRITIQKRGAISGAKFEPIIATGLGGGTISTIMQLKMGEQIAMVVTGALQTDPANSVPVTSFNAYRIGD